MCLEEKVSGRKSNCDGMFFTTVVVIRLGIAKKMHNMWKEKAILNVTEQRLVDHRN